MVGLRKNIVTVEEELFLESLLTRLPYGSKVELLMKDEELVALGMRSGGSYSNQASVVILHSRTEYEMRKQLRSDFRNELSNIEIRLNELEDRIK